MKKVLVVGEINVDLVLQGYHSFPRPGKEVLVDDFSLVLGSASAICAMGLARLGTPVAFLGRVGDDLWGRFCMDAMKGRGIDTSRVIVDPKLRTGLTVAITSPRDRALVSYLGSISALTAKDVPESAFRGFQHVHVGAYYLQDGLRPGVGEIFKAAHRLGLTTSLDPGFDPRQAWDGGLRETLQATDILFPNDLELSGLSAHPEPEQGLRKLQTDRTRVVAKLGLQGAMTLEKGEIVRVPAFTIEAVDTTGAGDSFNAGFLHAWLAGEPIPSCLRLGAACGALSTRGLGGTAEQPTREQAEAFMRKSGSTKTGA
jgi:sugar/nucleoside kinase (ribokinase family)